MVKNLFIGLIVLLLGAPAGFAAKMIGTTLPDRIEVNGTPLVLNGIGLREKYFVGIDIYVTGLYLQAPTADAQKIITADETMALKIKIVTGLVDAEKFQEATMTGFKESTNGNIEPFEKEIKMLMKAFSSEINNGDLFDLQYVKGEGVKIIKNGKLEVVIPGLPFKQAFFGIWLGDMVEKQMQTLRDQLLGKNGT
jgi:hypothetical protein